MREHEARPAWGAGDRADGQRVRATCVNSNAGRADGQVLFCNTRGQVCGRLLDGWLVKYVDTTKHQLRQPPAWAVDADHLRRLRALGAEGVRLLDERGTIWQARLPTFLRFGLSLERGHGEQVALPLAHWERRRAGEPEARQLGLWPAGGSA